MDVQNEEQGMEFLERIKREGQRIMKKAILRHKDEKDEKDEKEKKKDKNIHKSMQTVGKVCEVFPDLVHPHRSFHPLHFAAKHGHVEMVVFLIDKMGARVNDRGPMTFRGTALHIASIYHRSDVVKELLYRGADPLAKDHLHLTPLHRASWRVPNHPVEREACSNVLSDLVRASIASGDNCINKRDPHHRTALYFACVKGNAVVVRTLLHLKADWTLPGRYRNVWTTPEQTAARFRRNDWRDCVDLLRDHSQRYLPLLRYRHTMEAIDTMEGGGVLSRSTIPSSVLLQRARHCRLLPKVEVKEPVYKFKRLRHQGMNRQTRDVVAFVVGSTGGMGGIRLNKDLFQELTEYMWGSVTE